MANELRVLIVEDSSDDALLLVRELKRGAFEPSFAIVDTSAAMQKALERKKWDIILADYYLPSFSGFEALDLMKSKGIDLPFILVSGSIGEDTAVAAMKAGARDYLMKSSLTRLVPAVKRELQEAIGRQNRRKAEEALREGEKKYSTLVEKSNDGIVIIQDGLIKFANSRMIELTGYSLEAAIDMSFTDFIAPEYREFVAESYKQRMSGKEIPSRYETEITARDGRTIPVEISASIIEYEGKIADMVMVRDITERKKAEEALKESEEFSTSLLENAPYPIYVVERDSSIKYLNPALEKLTGFAVQEIVGQKPPFPWWPADMQEVHYKMFKEGFISGGTKMERLFQKKNGELFWVELTSTNVMKDGKLKYHMTNWVDITERKQAEELLKRAAEEWRATFDSITDWVSIHDRDFKLVRVNKAFARGFKMEPKEVIGKLCYEITHCTDSPPSFCPHRQTLETQKPATAEFYEPNLGIHLDVSTSPILNSAGEIIGSVHVTRDVTERKKMQDQLIINDRLASVGELASGIAHELNNPLTSVIGFSELLMDKKLPPDVLGDLKMINSEAQRTARVVKGLLTFARKHELVKQPVNVNDIIEKVLELRAYEHRVNNVEVIKHFMSGIPEITGDYFQLQQVFLNIVINAEYFMIQANGKGKLTIATDKSDNMVRIAISDDGPGMSEETIKHLFTPFYTTKPVGKGTGLGLSICHGIVTGHGGKIHAESGKGQGATFIIELPLSTGGS